MAGATGRLSWLGQQVDYHELYDALMSEQDDGNTNDAAHHTCSKVDVPLALDPAVTHSQPSPHALRQTKNQLPLTANPHRTHSGKPKTSLP